MDDNKRAKAVSKFRKRSLAGRVFTALIFWICLILVVTPIIVFGWILISSSMDSGSPVLGNRYEGDLEPAITASDMADIQSAAENISGVSQVDVEMATATLRVYADVNDSADADAVTAYADKIYSAVTSILNPNIYFTQSDGKKMYDLEIHVYNHSEETNPDTFVYVIKNKTSSMELPNTQLVSEPLDPELAQSLRDAVTARENGDTGDTAEDDGDVVMGDEDAEANAESEGSDED